MMEDREWENLEGSSDASKEGETSKSAEVPSSNEPSEVKLTKVEYDELVKKLDEMMQLKDRFLRSAADFENTKKRILKERDDFFKFALEGIVYDLLPVLDNFERAMVHTESNDKKIEALYQGFSLIQKQILTLLEERGLKRLETLGKKFDPHLHESVEHVISEDVAEGIIVEEVLAGYTLNEKLVRPAKVKVAHRLEGSKDGGQADAQS